MRRSTLAVAALTLAALLALQAGEPFARAGSGGSRGSRSSSAPARPAPTSPTNPSSPSRQLSSPTPAPAQPSRGWMGGLMGGLAGFALGGLLGSMLFGGFGHGFGGGIGLFEILLIGGGLFLLFRFMSARRQQQQPAYATAGAPYDSSPSYGSAYGGDAPRETATQEPTAPAVASDLDRGARPLRRRSARADGARHEPREWPAHLADVHGAHRAVRSPARGAADQPHGGDEPPDGRRHRGVAGVGAGLRDRPPRRLTRRLHGRRRQRRAGGGREGGAGGRGILDVHPLGRAESVEAVGHPELVV